MKISAGILVCIVFLYTGCLAPVKTPKEKNAAKLYNPSSSKIHPAFAVYHENENLSLLYVKIFPKELLYSQANTEGIYKATFKVNYTLYELGKPGEKITADSGTISYNFLRDGAEQRVIKEISLNAGKGKLYQLQLQAMDMVRREEVFRYIYIDKRNEFSQQNFMVIDDKSRNPLFAPYVLGNGQFRIRYNNPDKYRNLFISYYGSEMPLPKPSFTLSRESIFLSRPDSIWELPYNETQTYQLSYEGMYFIQFDTTIKEGLTLLNFGTDFPRIKNARQMVQPVAYISSPVEYETIKNAKNKKFAVDEFWLKNAEEIDRARELIRIYYTRVFYANYYFTSFKQGWMTDRGMIFIIYGPPQAIYVDIDKERWIYYKKNFSSSVTFIFDRMMSPYAENNYILERSESSEGHWKQAIDSWKSGRVFMLE